MEVATAFLSATFEVNAIHFWAFSRSFALGAYMLLDAIMSAAALDTTFGKGLSLMRAGKVDVFDVTYDADDESAHVAAFVEGSADSDYTASVVLEMMKRRVSHFAYAAYRSYSR